MKWAEREAGKTQQSGGTSRSLVLGVRMRNDPEPDTERFDLAPVCLESLRDDCLDGIAAQGGCGGAGRAYPCNHAPRCGRCLRNALNSLAQKVRSARAVRFSCAGCPCDVRRLGWSSKGKMFEFADTHCYCCRLYPRQRPGV